MIQLMREWIGRCVVLVLVLNGCGNVRSLQHTIGCHTNSRWYHLTSPNAKTSMWRQIYELLMSVKRRVDPLFQLSYYWSVNLLSICSALGAHVMKNLIIDRTSCHPYFDYVAHLMLFDLEVDQ